jgi:hypothetical protein
MIKVGVGDEHEVDVGQMMMGEAGMAEAADHQQPVSPVGVDQNVAVGPLNQEGGVTDPGDADLAVLQFGKKGCWAVAMAPLAGKKGGEEHIGDKTVRLLPAGMGHLRFHA